MSDATKEQGAGEPGQPRVEPGDPPPKSALAEHVLVVRPGTGANCSSIGSVVDMLFAGAAVGGALFAAACAALEREATAPAEPQDREAPPASDYPREDGDDR